MKQLRIIILAIIVTTTILACEDKTVYTDPMEESVKALDLDAELGEIFALPDGRAAALVKTTNYDEKGKTNCAIAVIDKNGNYTLSGVIDDYNTCELKYLYESSGMYYAKIESKDAEATGSLYLKLNNNVQPVYYYIVESNIIDSYNLENNCFDYQLYAMMDNGKFAEINTVVSNNDNGVQSKCKLRYLHYYDYTNFGEHNAFEYDIETADGFFATDAVTFEDKIIIYNEFDNEFSSKEGEYKSIELDDGSFQVRHVPYATIHNEFNEYYILNYDGSIVKSGKCDLPIQYIRYVDGNIYIITSDISLSDESDNQDIFKWLITKIDISGNEIYTSDTIKTFGLLGNITIDNGTLIIPGAVAIDYDNDEGCGTIFLLDDSNGTFKEQILLNYNEITVIPSVISPDQNGEYDVFALARHDYDDWNDYKKGDSEMSSGKLFIYHTNDLHKLQRK